MIQSFGIIPETPRHYFSLDFSWLPFGTSIVYFRNHQFFLRRHEYRAIQQPTFSVV